MAKKLGNLPIVVLKINVNVPEDDDIFIFIKGLSVILFRYRKNECRFELYGGLYMAKIIHFLLLIAISKQILVLLEPCTGCAL